VKSKKSKLSRPFLLFCQVAALAIAAFCGQRAYEIKELTMDSKNLKNVKVLEVYCRSRRGSIIKIDYEGQTKSVEVRRVLCQTLTEGDSVQLYYSKSSDFFHEPGNRRYERAIYGLSGFLLLSVVPWRRMFKK